MTLKNVADVCVCVCVAMIVMLDDTTDLTAWFHSAQDSSPLLFNGVQLYRENDSLVVLFATGIKNCLLN